VIGDGHLGIWAALRNVYPEAEEQRCWNHRMVNVLDRIGRRDQPVARDLLRKAAYAETVEAAGRAKKAFQQWCGDRGYQDAGRLLDDEDLASRLGQAGMRRVTEIFSIEGSVHETEHLYQRLVGAKGQI